MREINLIHWTTAGVFALSLHFAVLTFAGLSEKSGALAPGSGGVLFSLAVNTALIGSDEEPQTEDTSVEEPDDTLAELPDFVEPVPEPVEESEPPIEILVEPVVTAEIPDAPPPPVVEPLVKKVVNVTPNPTRKPVAVQRDVQPEKPKKSAVAKDRVIASLGQSVTGDVAQHADTVTSPGGGAIGKPSPDYLRDLHFWISKHKIYPKQARKRRLQGEVLLQFLVSRDGKILEFHILKSSGHSLLDEEVIAMLSRAQPFPKFPASMKFDIQDATIAIAFSLRGNR